MFRNILISMYLQMLHRLWTPIKWSMQLFSLWNTKWDIYWSQLILQVVFKSGVDSSIHWRITTHSLFTKIYQKVIVVACNDDVVILFSFKELGFVLIIKVLRGSTWDLYSLQWFIFPILINAFTLLLGYFF